ncbi:trypsin-like peptidase domain-containing protein [Shimia sp.]|uniref:trypsin-like serine peptidase n=1 Tax=Shimia sp. TaxID=1954381 RepID=UPI0032996CFC
MATKDDAIDVAHDLALLHLTEPMDITPIPLDLGTTASSFAILGYFDRRPHMLSAGFDCEGRTSDQGLVLDCGTRPGNSGGPILSLINDAWHVVSVVSAGNGTITIGAVLDNFVSP